VTVYRRGRTWSYGLDVGTDPEGRRKRIYQHGFRTRKEAADAKAAAITARRGGVVVDPSRLTLEAYLTQHWLPRKMPRELRWVEQSASAGEAIAPVVLDAATDPTSDHAGRVKVGTWHAYESHLRVHVVPRLGSIRLQELVAPHIDALLVDLADRGLSPKTVRNTYAVLATALTDAVRWGLLLRNPCDIVVSPKTSLAKFDAWSLEEVRTFLGVIADHEHLAAWLVFINTGMRRGELAGLTWPNVDLQHAELTVRWTYTESRGHTLWSPPKTRKGARRMALDPVTVDALRQWRTRQDEYRRHAGPAWRTTNADSFGRQMPDVVFTYPDGSMVRPQTWRRLLHKICDDHGLRRISPHALRHTYATLALQASESMADMKALSDRLGHSTIAFTLDKYADALPNHDRKLATDIARLWHGNQTLPEHRRGPAGGRGRGLGPL
jgi:integrase